MSFVTFLTISPPRHTNRTSKQKDDDPLGWSFLEPKWVFRGSAHCSFQNRRRRRQDRNALTGKHFTFTGSTHSMAPGKMLLVLSDFHRFVTDDRCVTQISIILMCYSSYTHVHMQIGAGTRQSGGNTRFASLLSKMQSFARCPDTPVPV